MTAPTPKHEPRPNYIGNSNTAPKLAWWYALCVKIGMMDKLLKRLEAEGVEAFYPARMTTRQTGKHLPNGKRELQRVARPEIPGYVFGRWQVEPDWRMLSTNLNVDFRPLRRTDGQAGRIIHTRDMQALWEKRIQIIDAEPPAPVDIKAGDLACFDLAGMRYEGVEVKEIRAGRAVMALTLFGAAEIQVALDQLEKSEQTS